MLGECVIVIDYLLSVLMCFTYGENKSICFKCLIFVNYLEIN